MGLRRTEKSRKEEMLSHQSDADKAKHIERGVKAMAHMKVHRLTETS